MSTPSLESELNPQQLEAVTHGEGPQLVIAGAGSGKTRVITHRIAWLIRERGVDPSEITAVTFTNKAASEMHGRVEELLQLFPLPTFVGTFHRFSLRLLRRYGDRVGLQREFAIMDTSDQRALIKEALEKEGLSEKAFAPRAVLAAISSAKNRLLDPAAYEREADHFFARKVALIYRRYQGLIRQIPGVDFDDMIALAVRLLDESPDLLGRVRRGVRYLLVDEYQDTNYAQLRLIQALNGPAGNLTAVGDEDQGIYRWRGAELGNILDFEESFPGATIRKLERNYRSTQNILDAAGALVARNTRRRGKKLWTEAGAGRRLELYRAADEGEEARWLVNSLRDLAGRHPLREMAILVRTNAQTRSLEDELIRQEVPYVLVGGTRFYERAEIKDLVAYLRLLRNPRDTYSLLRVINRPARAIGQTTQDRLKAEAESAGMPLWDLIHQDELAGLAARSARAVRAFHALIVGLQQGAAELPLPALLDRLLETTAYLDLFDREDPEGLARLENIQEFLSAAQEFSEKRSADLGDEDFLAAFLDHVSLVSDIDSWDAESGVSLMTLHSAKGLEFPVVAVAGLEDGLLPHFNAQGAPEDIEEERRLLYVGMTRAEQRLMLSCCRRRRIAGRYQDQEESRFLEEIPQDLLRATSSPSLFHRAPSRAQARGRARTRAEVAAFFGGEIETAYDDEEPAGGRTVRRGSRVRHATLGQGVVLELDGEGEMAKLTVFFDGSGKRRLVARYAKLELL